MSNPISQQEAIQAFITLANDMKSNGSSIQFVSTALMRACVRSIQPMSSLVTMEDCMPAA